MNEEMNVAANTEEVATPQIESTQPESQEVTTESTQPQVTETQSFARRLKEETSKAEQRARDEMIKELYAGQFNSYQEYLEAKKAYDLEQEAQKRNIDPEFYSEFNQIKNKLNSYEKKEMYLTQETQLSKDPVRGQFYNKYAREIKSMAESYDIDLQTAFTLLVNEKLPEILQETTKNIETETVKKINNNNITSTGSLSDGGNNQKPSISKMPKSDFDNLLQGVLRGEITNI